MTNKAYIVANEQQEREVLEKLEREGCVWHSNSTKPTEYIPSKHFIIGEQFPTAIVKIFNNRIMYETNYEDGNIKQDEEIIYDVRKESKMKISKEVYDALMEWRDGNKNNLVQILCIRGNNLSNIPDVLSNWWLHDTLSNFESNQRLIAIIRWVNGEDVFEVEKPKKWVVRSKDRTEQGRYLYVYFIDRNGIKDVMTGWTTHIATKFDTKEEAESWANAHQEVVQVEVEE